MTSCERPRREIAFDEQGLFVVFNDVKIAKRGLGPQARTWVSLELGYRVFDSADGIVVEYNGVRAQ